jgi:prepilin-type N-terminal cleavage/methylation domain-containing protein
MKRVKQTGFTIVELLVVIVVIGILAAITIVAYNGVMSRAKEAVLKSDLSNAQRILGADNATSGSYPMTTAQANEGKGLPASSGTSYQYSSDGTSYCLTATSSTAGIPVYHADSTAGGIKDGPCAGHSGSSADGLQVATLAGASTADFADGTGANARFNWPQGIALDSGGNIFVADYNTERVRKVTPAGVVTTFAGSDLYGQVDGQGSSAQFLTPADVAVDASNNVYVADYSGDRVRKITPDGMVTTLAGSSQGFQNGTGTAAKFSMLSSVTVDPSGNVYVADSGNDVIRKITPAGVVTTFAGSGAYGNANGTGTAAQFAWPNAVAADASGNVFVTDRDNNQVRKISPSGNVTTFAGSGVAGTADGTGTAAQFSTPGAITVAPSGDIYLTDGDHATVRKITPAGVVTTIAGSGTPGFADGPASSAQFNWPGGIAVNQFGVIYVADSGNNRIRTVN